MEAIGSIRISLANNVKIVPRETITLLHHIEVGVFSLTKIISFGCQIGCDKDLLEHLIFFNALWMS